MGRQYHKNYPAAMRHRYGVPPGQYSEGMGVVRSYQSVLRTDPTVPALFQLPKWEGRQILFQDPDGEVPVESVGEPIGGVRHPLTGEKLADQTTDSDRFMWSGVADGSDGDGGAHLEIDFTEWGGPYGWGTGEASSIVAMAAVESKNSAICGGDDSHRFSIYRSSSADELIIYNGNDLRARDLDDDYEVPDEEPIVYAALMKGEDSKIFMDGIEKEEGDAGSGTAETGYIGALENRDSLRLRGTIQVYLLYDEELSDDDFQEISEILA